MRRLGVALALLALPFGRAAAQAPTVRSGMTLDLARP